MVAKIDRTGEINYNNFGSEMIIKEYRGCMDVDVYFPEFNWVFKHTQYNNFKKGIIKCPYEKSVLGVGFIGEGKYKVWENDKKTKCYTTWYGMLQRCFDEECKLKHNTYLGVTVCEEWLNYQNFAKWYYKNYYEIEGQRMELDKDILVKGNKIYSPETCVFVPHNINVLFTKSDKIRGEYPIGVNLCCNKFRARCGVYDFKNNKKKLKHLGLYNTVGKAFATYKQFKEKYIKEVADYYKEQIPQKLYDAMYNYQVEITD